MLWSGKFVHRAVEKITQSLGNGLNAQTGGPGPVALAVDDEPQVLRLIVRCLKGEGYRVLTAHSRSEAERFLESSSSVELLVTDIFLGDGWGGELAFRLREKHPDLAVVFISGRTGDDPVLRHGIQRHMVFLEKPFTPVELAEAALEAVAEARLGQDE